MSALAKLGATIITYPILLVKSRLQAASKHTHADLKYKGTSDALRRIWKKEGQFCILTMSLDCFIMQILYALTSMGCMRHLSCR